MSRLLVDGTSRRSMDGVYLDAATSNRDGMLAAVDDGIILVQPRLSKHNIVAGEGEDEEIDVIGVLLNEHRGLPHQSVGMATAIVAQGDTLGSRGDSREAMLLNIFTVDEVRGAAGVDEDRRGATGDGRVQYVQAGAGRIDGRR